MEANGIPSIQMVLTTHKHWDHANGNPLVAATFPSAVIVGGEIDKPVACNRLMKDKQSMLYFDAKFAITSHLTPCHTSGHIMYEFEQRVASPESFELV